jgi:NAD(P)-dependent dehydrogenase (short-subunit alcohol dehydrogenase family)
MPGGSQIAFILGAGPNIGQSVVQTFASKGYKVALAARSLVEADSTDDQLNVKCDFSNPEDVVNAFARVNNVFGIPSVVVYNGRRPET